MHTNVSTILRRLSGLKVPLRQSFAQRLCEVYILLWGRVIALYDHIISFNRPQY